MATDLQSVLSEHLNVPKRRNTAQGIADELALPIENVQAALMALHAQGIVQMLHIKGNDGVVRVMWRRHHVTGRDFSVRLFGGR